MGAALKLPVEAIARAAAPAIAPRAGSLLRFITCGSVDDGKSTLIGRILYEAGAVFEDHLEALDRDSRKFGTNGQDRDFALLVDGLAAEREQGITIDVAYRYFSTSCRHFIVADTPGHEQYTRNMATGASTADLAVLLVDARAGLLEQTRRHAAIVNLMGIRQIILAVNKIDLVGYDKAVFDRIERAFRAYAGLLGDFRITAIPISALKGENIVDVGPDVLGWYDGPTLVEALEAAEPAARSRLPFRMPIQRVSRPGERFRGYQGTIAAGALAAGDRIVVAHSGEEVTVTRIVTYDGDIGQAEAGDAVTLAFDRPVDAARGDILALPGSLPLAGKGFAATVVSLQTRGLTDGARLLLKAAGRVKRVRLRVSEVYDLTTGEWTPSPTLPVNAIGRIRIRFDEDQHFDRFADCRETGAFILIDPQTNATLAGGMVLDLAAAEEASGDRVTLSLPRDLAELLLAQPAARARRGEITVTAEP